MNSITSIDPVFKINDNAFDEEIPEEIITDDLSINATTALEESKQTDNKDSAPQQNISKKKQAKADKKKEHKQNAKLKAQ